MQIHYCIFFLGVDFRCILTWNSHSVSILCVAPEQRERDCACCVCALLYACIYLCVTRLHSQPLIPRTDHKFGICLRACNINNNVVAAVSRLYAETHRSERRAYSAFVYYIHIYFFFLSSHWFRGSGIRITLSAFGRFSRKEHRKK